MENEITSPIKAIRVKCLDCSETVNEVRLCPVTKCPLYPFRFGKNPYLKKREYTEEELAVLRERLAKYREKKEAGDE